MQEGGRLHASLMIGRWEGATSTPQNHWEEITLKALPPESVLGSVKYAIRFLFNPRSHLTVILS